MRDGLRALSDLALEEIRAADTLAGLKELRDHYLGRKRGQIKGGLAYIPKLPSEVRSELGGLLNASKRQLEAAVREREKDLSASRAAAAPSIDITLPGRAPPLGSLHPITRTIRDIAQSFARLGFSWVSGPEVESAKYNFDGLNISEGHPARDREENFMISSEVLLRTQTSTVQVRVMESRRPPLRIIAPGRVYRPDTVDATHHFMFHQVEGLMVDRDVTFRDLKTVLGIFARDLFGPEALIRLRPSFFPFTEPSAEMDVSCAFCDGKGCSVCKGTGWIEMAGCGMVDPSVFEFAGIDPDEHSGFAFGLGVDRITMIRYQIKDIRLFTENDVRFLAQF
ncbi:MAG: phenylalanine--tRNA ligase subunit alpha [Planctomycetota bacterium]|nr:phenylalanine--tRNA ligase subunit alpha [Planctomycetota bacterium]